MQFPPPPEVLATWPTPNYENPVSRGPSLMIIEVITLFLALLALVIRLYVKFGLLRKPRWDDYLMIVAAISAIGLTVTVILANTVYGWNHHIWDLQFDDLVTARKVSLAAQLLYLFSSTLAKISILLSYIYLAVPDSHLHRLSQVAIVLISLSNASIFITIFAQCTPVSSYWDIMRVSEDCHIREGHFLMAQAGMTVVADLIVWFLPLPTLYKARLPLKQRLALIVLFSFGAVVVIAACVRTYWLWWAVLITWDMTWDCFDEWIWTAVEVHLGIICGCVPWLRSLVNLWREKTRRETERSNGYLGKSLGAEHLGSGSSAMGKGTAGGRSKHSIRRSIGGGEMISNVTAGTRGRDDGGDGTGPYEEYDLDSPVAYNTTPALADAKTRTMHSSEWWDHTKGNGSSSIKDDSDGTDLIFQRPGDGSLSDRSHGN